jgi:hypothetical protein
LWVLVGGCLCATPGTATPKRRTIIELGFTSALWTSFGGTKDLSGVEGAAGRPTHLAADAGFMIASLVAVLGLRPPSSTFRVGSVSNRDGCAL